MFYSYMLVVLNFTNTHTHTLHAHSFPHSHNLSNTHSNKTTHTINTHMNITFQILSITVIYYFEKSAFRNMVLLYSQQSSQIVIAFTSMAENKF